MKAFLAKQLQKPSGFLGRLVARVMAKTNDQAYQTLLRHLSLQPGEHVYEIGYGPGEGIEWILKKRIPCTISGIDFSELMYRSATQRHRKAIRQGSVHLTYGDFMTCQTEPNHYHKVIAVNVIYFWPDAQIPFRKIYNMLVPNGQLLLFMRDTHYLEKKKLLDSGVFHPYSMDQVEQILLSTGFRTVTHQHTTEGYFIEAFT